MIKKSNISIFVPHLGCPNQCSFCDQRAITGKQKAPDCDDVKQAIETALKSKNYKCELAFFGGSFTAIERSYMESLLKSAYPYVKSGEISGIRISTRPDCIDEEILSTLKSFGVTSIELGAQSMNNRVLELNRRGHTAQDVCKASKIIKEAGFELGLQMMTGLYGDTYENALLTATSFIEIGCKTVRIYPTVVLKNTYLESLMLSGDFKPWGVEESVELCAELYEMFEYAGIKVIRVGLHSSSGVKENAVGGAYHEAFGELVQSKIFLNKILKYPPGNYTVWINKKSLSKLNGQKKQNLKALSEMGYVIKTEFSEELKPNELRIN